METAAENRSTILGRKLASRGKGVSTMMSRLREMVRRLGETECDMPDAWRDPLSHPAIRGMSARELADLPFTSRRQR